MFLSVQVLEITFEFFFPFQREKVALTCTCYTLNIQVLGPTSPCVTIEQILILLAILHCKHEK